MCCAACNRYVEFKRFDYPEVVPKYCPFCGLSYEESRKANPVNLKKGSSNMPNLGAAP